MKFSEKEIQNYIWNNRDNFLSFLDELEDLNEVSFQDDLSDLNAQSLIRNRINQKLSKLHTKLFELDLIGCEVPLEQKSNSTIRADFLATFPGDTGLAIVELKKSSQTERQAFTELLAYSNHLTTLFPAMSREDSVYILISPMTTRIARDAVIQSLTFDNRQIVALIPEFDNPNDITTLKLKLWKPTDSELAKFSNVAFNENNFSVCKIVWEYNEERWDAARGENPSPELIEQFNSVASLAAQQMEEAGIHGFTYCSQTWSELVDHLPYTNSLVLVGLNPYAVGGAQHLTEHYDANPEDIPHPLSYLPNINELIPKGIDSEDSEHIMPNLYSVWSSQLFRIGRRVVESATKTIDGKEGHIDQGFLDWGSYQRQALEDVYCHNFLIKPTGLLRVLYNDVMTLDYDICQKVGLENHPIHGDMPYLGVDYLTSHAYFRPFILRMFGTGEEYS
ncbi:hypothetical protein BCT19_11790 [Vibrio splendidus]|uniref:hypothetical protein n=1 Tax=Vibrio splendidus TaxID=29497 RepID=UPI000C837158|nr:hypothetical protein [Vibrio splendidus]PMO05156.1 hypothetical protein BCT19_11790 [Vibrio splendidus]